MITFGFLEREREREKIVREAEEENKEDPRMLKRKGYYFVEMIASCFREESKTLTNITILLLKISVLVMSR